MSTVGVRSYVADDGAAVRDIPYRTDFMGESTESFWGHKESWANLTARRLGSLREPQFFKSNSMKCINIVQMTEINDECLLKMEEQRSVLLWGGLAGMLGGIIFILIFVIVIAFVGVEPTEPEGEVMRFPDIRAVRTLENSL